MPAKKLPCPKRRPSSVIADREALGGLAVWGRFRLQCVDDGWPSLAPAVRRSGPGRQCGRGWVLPSGESACLRCLSPNPLDLRQRRCSESIASPSPPWGKHHLAQKAWKIPGAEGAKENFDKVPNARTLIHTVILWYSFVVQSPPPPPNADAHPSAHKSVLESANPRRDSEGASGCPWSTARATAPSPGPPTPGVVKQDKSSGGSIDTTKTRSGPQRVRMSSGERPIGAANGKQSETEALCQPPPPPSLGGTQPDKRGEIARGGGYDMPHDWLRAPHATRGAGLGKRIRMPVHYWRALSGDVSGGLLCHT